MKRLLIGLISLVVMIGIYAMPVSAAGSGRLSMGNASGVQGGTVSVPVSITSNLGLITMKFSISYGSNLELISVSNSGLLGGWTTPSPTISSPYTIRWADSLAQANNTATGKILTLNFRIKSSAPIGKETVSLNFQESRDANGGTNSFSGASASISISCVSHRFGAYTNVNGNSHQRSCSACGYVETTGHTWDAGTVTKNASCKETGLKQLKCTACAATKNETIPKSDKHSYGKWDVVKEATCTENGSRTRDCSVCGQKENGKIEALGHDFKKAEIVKEATTTETGLKEGKCKRCGEVVQEVIPKLENKSSDTSLAGITVDDFFISPPFQNGIDRYVVWLPFETTAITTHATPTDAKASVSISGGTDLVAGSENTITITCTAEDGTTKEYYVIAKRAAEDGSEIKKEEPKEEQEAVKVEKEETKPKKTGISLPIVIAISTVTLLFGAAIMLVLIKFGLLRIAIKEGCETK